MNNFDLRQTLYLYGMFCGKVSVQLEFNARLVREENEGDSCVIVRHFEIADECHDEFFHQIPVVVVFAVVFWIADDTSGPIQHKRNVCP